MAQGCKKRAPSLWLKYQYDDPGDILMQEVFVPSCGLAKCTYYCCLNWNSGREGGGYCGIQDHPDGRAFIFSIWDPTQVRDVPITAVVKGPGTWTDRFGGEGTGLKSMNFELGWKEDQWYTMVVRRWDSPDGLATRFGCWVEDQKQGVWTHLITMEYPVPRVCFEGVTVSFLEDWGFTCENYRCVHYRGGFKRRLDRTWMPFSSAEFQVNMHDIDDGTATTSFDARCPDPSQGVCMAAGGTAHGDSGTSCIFQDETHAHRRHPQQQPVKLRQVEVREKMLTWVADRSTAPQFAYRVKRGEQELYCGRGESVAGLRLEDGGDDDGGDGGEKAKEKGTRADLVVELEDILGNRDQATAVV